MPIRVNTVQHEWVEGETVAALLARMGFIYPMVVVKVNGSVVPKTRHGTEAIPDGALVEVIHIESGG